MHVWIPILLCVSECTIILVCCGICHWALPYIASYPDQLRSIKQHWDFPRKFILPFPFIGGKYAKKFFYSSCIRWFCSVAYLDSKWIPNIRLYLSSTAIFIFWKSCMNLFLFVWTATKQWLYTRNLCSLPCLYNIQSCMWAYTLSMYKIKQHHYLFVCLSPWFPEKYTLFARTSTILQMVLWIWEFDAAKKIVSIFVFIH